MNQQKLTEENERFKGTVGVSENNRCAGFLPAFRHEVTGRVELARLPDGKVATMHLITWLPVDWAESVDDRGGIVGLKKEVVSGFVRNGEFFTREEVTRLKQ